MAPNAPITPTSCPLCPFSAKRITAVNEHVKEAHGLEPKEAHDRAHGPTLCKCGCGRETNFVNLKKGYSSVVNGHNGSIYAVHDAETASAISEKRSASLTGQVSWAKGLSKETDERIEKRADGTSRGRKKAFDEGRIQIWSKGKTKETDERIQKAANDSRAAFESGERVAWHKGLTKEMDPRLAQKGAQLHDRFDSGELVPWHRGLTADDDPRLNKAWRFRDPMKEYAHLRFTHEEIEGFVQNNTQIRLERIDRYRNSKTPALWMRCVSCEWFEKTTLEFAAVDRCPRCAPAGSRLQHQIANWIESTTGMKVARNIRGLIGRRELDIYVPEKKLAIEVNGLYWHNEASGKDSQYHEEKRAKCAKIGVELIHIFEDEWHQKGEIIKGIIRRRLDIPEERVDGDDCDIVRLDPVERTKFFEENHLEGDVRSTITFALQMNSVTLAAISLRTPQTRTEKRNKSLEVTRAAVEKNHIVEHWCSYLTSTITQWALENGYAQVNFWASIQHGQDDWAGDWMVHETAAPFWWTDGRKRFLSKPEGIDVVRIWGCKGHFYALDIEDPEKSYIPIVRDDEAEV